jgi:hypothetical protein
MPKKPESEIAAYPIMVTLCTRTWGRGRPTEAGGAHAGIGVPWEEYRAGRQYAGKQEGLVRPGRFERPAGFRRFGPCPDLDQVTWDILPQEQTLNLGTNTSTSLRMPPSPRASAAPLFVAPESVSLAAIVDVGHHDVARRDRQQQTLPRRE